jgi:PAS domain-containing protein
MLGVGARCTSGRIEACQSLVTARRGTLRRRNRTADSRVFELLVQGVTDYAIYMLDPEGRVSTWNAGARRLKGYDEAEIIGRHFSRFFNRGGQGAGLAGGGSRDGAPCRTLRGRRLAHPQGRHALLGERRHRPAARRNRTGAFSASRRSRATSRADSRTTTGCARASASSRLLVNGVTDYALYMLDLNGNVTSWNSGAERIKGYAAQEIIGQHFSRFYTEGRSGIGPSPPARSQPPRRPAASRRRAGGCARTASASGPAW